MNYTETQLEAIKLFGRKDLTEGCVVEAGDFKEIGTYLIRLKDRIYIRTGDFITNRHYTEIKETLGHIPHFERILEVLYEKDIAVSLWNTHKKSIVLDFLNEKDDECRIREIDYDWTKELLEQDEKVLKELIEIVENAK